MFKTDQKSLEELSFSLKEKDLANFKSILEKLKAQKLLTLSEEEIQRTIEGLNTIGKLKLEGKIYAFHVDDCFARLNGNGEGVELYFRQGNRLQEYFVPNDRDGCYSPLKAIQFLKSQEKFAVYTGKIPFNSHFLGLPHKCDSRDPITRGTLENYEIEQFLEEKIDVIKLDSLI